MPELGVASTEAAPVLFMPDLRPGESRDDFLERCIPIVLEDETAADPTQANAVCNSMYEEQSQKQLLMEPVNARGWTERMTLLMARQQPEGKFSKADAGYMALAPGAAKVCGRCRFFNRLPGNQEFGMCEVVEGPIAPLGTSLLFIDAGQTAEYILGQMQPEEPVVTELVEDLGLVPVEEGQFYSDDEDEDRRSKEAEVTNADLDQTVDVEPADEKQDEKPHKTVDGTRLFVDDFASVGDRDAPLTWKLPLAKNPGTPDPERIAGAITAMQPGGFRGQRVELTAPKDQVIRKISAAIGKLDDEDAQDRLRGRLDTLKSSKAGRRVRVSKVQALKDLKAQFEKLLKELGKLVGWADYADAGKLTWVGFQQAQGAMKTFKGTDGRTYLLTWTTNAFKDRDGEIFSTQSIEELIARMDGQKNKGTFRFWHVPGADFADIEGQAMSGRFLVEWGPFKDGPIGDTFKAFFQEFPQKHPTIAPEGWGSSHGYRYIPEDRKDGVYEWFDKHETSVLPSLAAANPYNPRQEVFKVDDKQRAALEAIGGKDLVDLVVTTGESLTKDLEEADVAFKASEPFAEKIGALLEDIEDDALRTQVERIMTALGKTAAKMSNGNGDGDAEAGDEPAGDEEASPEGEAEEAEKIAALEAIDEELAALAKDFTEATDMKKKLANLGRQLKLVAGRVGGKVGGKLKQIADEIIAADEIEEEEAAGAEKESQPSTFFARTKTEEDSMDEAQPDYVTRDEVAEGFEVLGQAIAELGTSIEAQIDEKVAEKVPDEVDKKVEEELEGTPAASLKEIARLSVIGKEETKVDGRSKEAKDGPEEAPAETETKSRTGIPFIDQMLANEDKQLAEVEH